MSLRDRGRILYHAGRGGLTGVEFPRRSGEYSLINDPSPLSHLPETSMVNTAPAPPNRSLTPLNPAPAIVIVVLILHVTRTMVVALFIPISPSLGSRERRKV